MQLLNFDGLKAKGIGYSRPHLWRLMRAGKFPKPIKLGANRNAWIDAEIEKWIEARIAQRDQLNERVALCQD